MLDHLLALADFLDKVNGAAAIAPLVVVPTHELDDIPVQSPAPIDFGTGHLLTLPAWTNHGRAG
jgi:hypothetical protein